jgi:hypothetical protein
MKFVHLLGCKYFYMVTFEFFGLEIERRKKIERRDRTVHRSCAVVRVYWITCFLSIMHDFSVNDY